MPQFTDLKKEYDGNEWVEIDDRESTLTFKIQEGPIGEVGVNGCQIDELGNAWLSIIKKFNDKYPCNENNMAITHIEQALIWQKERTENRKKRGVEGFNKV